MLELEDLVLTLASTTVFARSPTVKKRHDLSHEKVTLGRTVIYSFGFPSRKGLYILHSGRIVFAQKKVSLFYPLAKFSATPM